MKKRQVAKPRDFAIGHFANLIAVFPSAINEHLTLPHYRARFPRLGVTVIIKFKVIILAPVNIDDNVARVGATRAQHKHGAGSGTIIGGTGATVGTIRLTGAIVEGGIVLACTHR